MIVNMNSDEQNVTNTKKLVMVEKTVPVPGIVLIGSSVESGNKVPSNATTDEVNDTAEEEADRKKLDESVKGLNEHMQVIKRELRFTVDDDSGKTVIKVMDLATQQVIRQIPNEEALKAARSLGADFDIELFSEYT